MRATLRREASTDLGTFGRFTLEDGWTCHSLELPWRDNRARRSCIPAGSYRAALSFSPKFERPMYELAAVPDRSQILIHAGNHAGDVTLGLKSDVEGCILLGLTRGSIGGQLGIGESRAAIARLIDLCQGQPLTLKIEEATHGNPALS
ncbi:DUF5675 family protein [Lacibacterium aquatile]|uniref:DUF5675 family protein n=1 Tax=Lacibacterium aquatile TaxID=1168082 RepID=A0ABW5DXC1_9PROT